MEDGCVDRDGLAGRGDAWPAGAGAWSFLALDCRISLQLSSDCGVCGMVRRTRMEQEGACALLWGDACCKCHQSCDGCDVASYDHRMESRYNLWRSSVYS